jgi:hypothetical protein
MPRSWILIYTRCVVNPDFIAVSTCQHHLAPITDEKGETGNTSRSSASFQSSCGSTLYLSTGHPRPLTPFCVESKRLGSPKVSNDKNGCFFRRSVSADKWKMGYPYAAKPPYLDWRSVANSSRDKWFNSNSGLQSKLCNCVTQTRVFKQSIAVPYSLTCWQDYGSPTRSEAACQNLAWVVSCTLWRSTIDSTTRWGQGITMCRPEYCGDELVSHIRLSTLKVTSLYCWMTSEWRQASLEYSSRQHWHLDEKGNDALSFPIQEEVSQKPLDRVTMALWTSKVVEII